MWEREEQSGKPKGKEGQTAASSPPHFAQQPTSFPLSATSKRTVVAGKKRKGKLSQDPGFLYILLPEQRRGRKTGKGPRLPVLPDVGVRNEKIQLRRYWES